MVYRRRRGCKVRVRDECSDVTEPRGTGGGSNPTGGEFIEEITGRVMQGMKEFLTISGSGGAGMFPLTEWIMKSAVWFVLLFFVYPGYLMEQRSGGKCERWICRRFVVLSIADKCSTGCGF
ncbi:MAG: hypothetical protein U9N09_03715 [Euryarchaeota archaeon]|nr:hypothetical protein [Euryarchaeota archaeon]